ncbi:MAG TPA: CvpA family protein [Terriglobales bacterium]|nr:CvpA family protein [Terriglobales bacterium]
MVHITAVPRGQWFSPVNWVDLSVLTVLVLFGLRGFFRGFFREIFSLAGMVAGFMLAVAYERPVSAWIAYYWHLSPLFLKGVAFIAIFFSVYFLLSLFGWLLHRSEKLLFLKMLNRVGGIVIGAGKGTAVVAIAVFLLSTSSWLPQPTREGFVGAYLVSPLSWLAENLIRIGKERILADQSAGENPTTSSLRL